MQILLLQYVTFLFLLFVFIQSEFNMLIYSMGIKPMTLVLLAPVATFLATRTPIQYAGFVSDLSQYTSFSIQPFAAVLSVCIS